MIYFEGITVFMISSCFKTTLHRCYPSTWYQVYDIFCNSTRPNICTDRERGDVADGPKQGVWRVKEKAAGNTVPCRHDWQ